MTDAAWRERAACRRLPPELFVPDARRYWTRELAVQVETAKAICRGCPVREECLAFGRQSGEAGVWGGQYLKYRQGGDNHLGHYVGLRDGRPEPPAFGSGAVPSCGKWRHSGGGPVPAGTLTDFLRSEARANGEGFTQEYVAWLQRTSANSATFSGNSVPPRSSLVGEGNTSSRGFHERSDDMTTKTTKTEKPVKADKPKRQTTRAADLFEPVTKVLRDAGPEGLTLAQASDLTGVRPRILHNVLYHLEKAEKVRRVQEAPGKRVRFASTEVKAKPAPRKRAARKTTTAKKATTSKAA